MHPGTTARAPSGRRRRLTASRPPIEGSATTENAVQDGTSPLASVSNALVALHKEQFGRGPTRARSEHAGANGLVCFLEDALLPAEKSIVEMGAGHRVQESRLFFQNATAPQFIGAVEEIMGRKVRSFASATDPEAGVVMEIFLFFPRDDGASA